MSRLPLAAFPLAVALGVVAPGAPAQTLADLGFMTGCWRGTTPSGIVIEESYTTPSDNVMLGTTRYLEGTRARQFEFTLITADEEAVTLLPYPGGRASEHAFTLTAVGEGSARFEAPEHDFPRRIAYHRASDGWLVARIDGGEGSDRSQQWRMAPVGCPVAGG